MKKLVLICFAAMLLSGCPLDGDNGTVGPQGEAGISCWDINGDGVQDASEDVNGDGQFTAADCQALTSIEQHPEAKFNFKSFCDAFANLGQYPDGCPSAAPTLPTGSLVRIIGDQFADNNRDPEFIESLQSALLSIRVDGSVAYWSLHNSYVVDQFSFSAADLNDPCKTACEGDGLCVAAYAVKNSGATSYTCNVFHYSDTLTVPWEGFCGVDTGNLSAADSCGDNVGDGFRWYALDPGT
ncbi:hypothetical protein ACT0HR_003516 [Vibrio alginolyticus]